MAKMHAFSLDIGDLSQLTRDCGVNLNDVSNLFEASKGFMYGAFSNIYINNPEKIDEVAKYFSAINRDFKVNAGKIPSLCEEFKEMCSAASKYIGTYYMYPQIVPPSKFKTEDKCKAYFETLSPEALLADSKVFVSLLQKHITKHGYDFEAISKNLRGENLQVYTDRVDEIDSVTLRNAILVSQILERVYDKKKDNDLEDEEMSK